MSTDRRNPTDGDEIEGDVDGGTGGDGGDGGDSGDGGVNGGEVTSETNDGERAGERSQRDVVVPRELYKIVTVFSTLIAIVAVVGGFVLLDTATNRTLAAASEVNLPLAIAGVGAIVLGAAVYAFASRFRTRGMGSPNNDADEP
jgi:uncharacterized integral membrane protein